MADIVLVTGMVLEVSPVNDYDRRLVILTKERGKISAFCRGARRINNKLMAATNQFAFGTFKLYEGRNAYNIQDAEITHYFEELRTDLAGAYLGMYFLEVASYYTRENNDDVEMLKLLFQTIRAIVKDNIDNRLIRSIYEIKSLQVNGEFPGIPENIGLSDGAKHAVNFIVSTKAEKVYTFAVSDSVLDELIKLSSFYMDKFVDKKFKSLEMLEIIS